MCEGKIDFSCFKLSIHQLESIAETLKNSFSQWKSFAENSSLEDELVRLLKETEDKANETLASLKRVSEKIGEISSGTSATITPIS